MVVYGKREKRLGESFFKKITEDTCNRRGFKDKTLTYYQNMYNTFKDQVVFYICELDIPKYIKLGWK